MKRNIGAHVSAAGGLHQALERATAIGCTSVQLFSGSPRVWQRKQIADIVTPAFFEARNRLGLTPIITHGLYLVNLASDISENVHKSAKSLAYELQFDAAIGGGGVVVHIGSHQGRGWEAVREQIVSVIAQLLLDTPENSTFLIENAAGQNGKVGGNLVEVAELLELLEKKGSFVSSNRLGWCFDTCHAYAAGYFLGSAAPQEALFAAEKIGRLPQSASEVITSLGLWESLRCVHVNDSRDPFGSGRDRHANIGDGDIIASDMQAFLQHPELLNLPLILEVPGIAGEGPDAENVTRLKKLLE